MAVMVELGRTVRLSLNRGPAGAAAAAPPHNSFSAWPAMRGLGSFYQVHVTCRGEIDPVTGYAADIKDIDHAVRTMILPALHAAAPRGAAAGLGAVLRRLLHALQAGLDREVTAVRLELSPFYHLEIRSQDMAHLLVRQQFEFSAAHRLNVPRLSAAANRRLFGRCNNPSGHGHNYRLEVVVRGPIDRRGRVVPVEALDALVDKEVLRRLDHKHLNLDVPAFARLIPSVENIATVIAGLLAHPVRRLGAELEEVSVWETSKTVCTWRAEPPAVRGLNPGRPCT
jgi:6-pyruvoyltetrahydropterin/6-carboxytetrahydropterin synthase